MCKSLCSMQLEMYHSALVMDRRIFDCSRWMICVWDGFAQPQSCVPYVHTGLSTHFYTRSLFSRVSFDLQPRIQYMLHSFGFKYWHFALICVRQLGDDQCVILDIWHQSALESGHYSVTGGQSACLVINVMCADFAWLILIFHLSNQVWRMLRWCWSCCEATGG